MGNAEESGTLSRSLVRRRAGKLGGGGAGGAIYGELTFKSFSRVVEFLKSKCNFTPSSTFIDIGAGLGNMAKLFCCIHLVSIRRG